MLWPSVLKPGRVRRNAQTLSSGSRHDVATFFGATRRRTAAKMRGESVWTSTGYVMPDIFSFARASALAGAVLPTRSAQGQSESSCPSFLLCHLWGMQMRSFVRFSALALALVSLGAQDMPTLKSD